MEHDLRVCAVQFIPVLQFEPERNMEKSRSSGRTKVPSALLSLPSVAESLNPVLPVVVGVAFLEGKAVLRRFRGFFLIDLQLLSIFLEVLRLRGETWGTKKRSAFLVVSVALRELDPRPPAEEGMEEFGL
mmetsp:Transcript_34277/g.134418  ORF Transcript_34277/g.134418 Transcript_34277/m.134418 type:complete len:130 (-) Transcript_34277:1433-1822(-)